MVTDRKKQLIDTVEVIVNLVRVVQLRRAIQDASPEMHLSFWILINNSLLDTAVLDWCKLFGSDDEEHQPTHWKNVVADKDAFRNGLFSAAGVTKAKWEAYWVEMKKYRDNAVAHRSEKRREIPNFPKYELALKSAQFYFERVVPMLRNEFGITQEPATLKTYAQTFFEQAVKISRVAVGATVTLREEVDV